MEIREQLSDQLLDSALKNATLIQRSINRER
jgi:hypothetical protein